MAGVAEMGRRLGDDGLGEARWFVDGTAAGCLGGIAILGSDPAEDWGAVRTGAEGAGATLTGGGLAPQAGEPLQREPPLDLAMLMGFVGLPRCRCSGGTIHLAS